MFIKNGIKYPKKKIKRLLEELDEGDNKILDCTFYQSKLMEQKQQMLQIEQVAR